jgi:hypothetical protein
MTTHARMVAAMEPRSSIEVLIPVPRRRELDHVDLAAPPLEVWESLRDGRMAWPFLVRALQRARARSRPAEGRRREPPLALGELRSTRERPGLHLLAEEPGRELTLGAVVAMRLFTFELLPITDRETFASSREPGLVRLVWSIQLSPLGSTSCRLRVELRIDAADALTWHRFARTYLLLGPFSRLLRRRVLASLADQWGAPELTRRPPAAARQAGGGSSSPGLGSTLRDPATASARGGTG